MKTTLYSIVLSSEDKSKRGLELKYYGGSFENGEPIITKYAKAAFWLYEDSAKNVVKTLPNIPEYYWDVSAEW